MWKTLYQVDLEIKESSLDYNFGNALVVNLVFNDRREYKNGNTLVVKTSLIEMECVNFLKVVDLW